MTRLLHKPLARIGLFHFVTNHDDPIGSLTDARSRHDDIGNSLIVLPEAFNNGEVFYDQPAASLIRADNIVERLTTIATERDLVFIVGLLEPPNNSAYLIDSGGARLMGHKRAHSGISNPIEINGTCIGALICSDARDHHREWLLDKVEQSPCAHKVICISASMTSGTFDSDRFDLSGYRDKYVVLANAQPPPPKGCGSFLANKAGRKVGNANFNHVQNAIILATWNELDDLSTRT